MTTLMLTLRDRSTSERALFQLVMDSIDISYRAGAAFVSCRKRGTPFWKCKEGHRCPHVHHWPGDEYSPGGDWVNGDGDICPNKHPGESPYSVVERLGQDPRVLKDFALYIHHPDPNFVLSSDLKTLYPAYAFRNAARWVEPKVTHKAEFKISNFRWPVAQDTACSFGTFTTFGMEQPRRELGFRYTYDHMSESLNYFISIQDGTGCLYRDW